MDCNFPLVYVFNFVQIDNENLWIVWIWAFFSFRFFDIIKLGLVSWADNLKGALGVILDDIFAGIAAALTVLSSAISDMKKLLLKVQKRFFKQLV